MSATVREHHLHGLVVCIGRDLFQSNNCSLIDRNSLGGEESESRRIGRNYCLGESRIQWTIGKNGYFRSVESYSVECV